MRSKRQNNVHDAPDEHVDAADDELLYTDAVEDASQCRCGSR
jgi:hypothetical protein